MDRILVLFIIFCIMAFLVYFLPESLLAIEAGPTLTFGFIILSAYLLALILARLALPKITGYIFAGILFGPSLLGFVSQSAIEDLKLVDDLALTFIAFAAGSELHLAKLRERKKSIILTLVFQFVFILVGVTSVTLALRSVFPLTSGLPFTQALAVAALCGAIAVARSPSSAIAIISETKAKGPFTEMVLGVTIAADVLTILFFAIVLSLSEFAISAGKSLDTIFVFGIIFELIASIGLGLFLAWAMELYLEKVDADLTIFLLSISFLVTKISQSFASFLDANFGVYFHLEPMLICLTAGFYLKNYSRSGIKFVKIINRSSLPIYVVFFAIGGASLNLEALQHTWHWAFFMVFLRVVFIYLSAFIGGYIGSDPPKFYRVSGLGFIAQAGVSLGLAKLIADRFDTFGAELSTLLFATIAINQILGPVTFKYALTSVGESKT